MGSAHLHQELANLDTELTAEPAYFAQQLSVILIGIRQHECFLEYGKCLVVIALFDTIAG